MFFKKKTQLTEEEIRQRQQDAVYQEGMTSILDIIAPSSFEIMFDYLKVGNNFVRTLFVYEYSRFLEEGWLLNAINVEIPLDISIFITPEDTAESLKTLRAKSTQVESSLVMEAEKGLTRNPALEARYADIEEMRDKVTTQQSKMFKNSIYITVYAESLEILNEYTKNIENILGQNSVLVKHANLKMEQGFNSTLPMGKDELLAYRNFTTEAVAVGFPFASATLSNNEGILYGANALNSSLVIFDRFKLPNYNSVILGTSGAGKSYAVKLELLRLLMFDADIIVIDPEKEFDALCEAVGGTYIDINLNSNQRINPFDLPQTTDKDERKDVLTNSVSALTSLLKVMLQDITVEEENVLDDALTTTYSSKGITHDPSTHHLTPPLMSDLKSILESTPGGEHMASRLKKYTEGTFAGLFNDFTNVSLASRFTVFNIRDLEEELRPIAMHSILNFIWGKVKEERKKRILAIDEAWILMKHEDSAQFLFSMAKRGRKYYLGLTTIGQDVGDFLKSEYGKQIISNASMSILLKQHPSQADMIQEVFALTDAERNYLLQCPAGNGIFMANMEHAYLDIFRSESEDLIVTTNPQQLKEMEEGDLFGDIT